MSEETTEGHGAVAGRVEQPVRQRLYEPWNASLKTKRTHNIGIYNRVGELVATLDVHQCATEATQTRRMREARMMAAAPELLDALRRMVEAVTGVDQVSAVNDARDAIAKATGCDA